MSQERIAELKAELMALAEQGIKESKKRTIAGLKESRIIAEKGLAILNKLAILDREDSDWGDMAARGREVTNRVDKFLGQ